MTGFAESGPFPLEAQREIHRLRELIEASKRINSSLEPAVLFDSILQVAREQIDVERGTLFFVDARRGELWARISSDPGVDEIRLPIGQGIAGAVAMSGESLILHDVRSDPRFDPSTDRKSGFHTQSMLCVPIRNRSGRIVGVLQLLNKRDGQFGPQDLAFLDSVSDHMAIAMDNAALHRDALVKDRMEQELLLGREIQTRLLPQAPTDVPGLEIAAATRFCYEVGGDYYDFIRRASGRLDVGCGDVSGKGVSAALIMSSLQAALRVASPLEHDLVRLLVQTNGILHTMTRGRKYVTLFFGRYEPATGELEYVNAGHNAPLLVSDRTVRRLPATGRPIGLLPSVTYETARVVLPPGGLLLLYSDGLTEATNAAEEEFGVERLEAAAAAAAELPAGEVLESVLSAVSAFEDGVEPADDKTAVVLRRR